MSRYYCAFNAAFEFWRKPRNFNVDVNLIVVVIVFV